MSKWAEVGEWVKRNAGTGAALVGSLLTGNVPGAVAAGVSLVSSATGTNDPGAALAALQGDPATVARLRELANENEAAVRSHIESMERLKLEDAHNEHSTTQATIQGGDVALDDYVRRTRPRMARQSWTATVAYCLGCLLFRAGSDGNVDIFSVYIAGVLSAPAWAYLGLRTGDKIAGAWQARGASQPGAPGKPQR